MGDTNTNKSYKIQTKVIYSNGITIFNRSEASILEWGLDDHINMYNIDKKTGQQQDLVFSFKLSEIQKASTDWGQLVLGINGKKYRFIFFSQETMSNVNIENVLVGNDWGHGRAIAYLLSDDQASNVNIWITMLKKNNIQVKNFWTMGHTIAITVSAVGVLAILLVTFAILTAKPNISSNTVTNQSYSN